MPPLGVRLVGLNRRRNIGGCLIRVSRSPIKQCSHVSELSKRRSQLALRTAAAACNASSQHAAGGRDTCSRGFPGRCARLVHRLGCQCTSYVYNWRTVAPIHATVYSAPVKATNCGPQGVLAWHGPSAARTILVCVLLWINARMDVECGSGRRAASRAQVQQVRCNRCITAPGATSFN